MNDYISTVAFESVMARFERTIKRLWILLIILVLLLVGSNVAWLVYESQFEDQVITQEVHQDADCGDNEYSGNIIGGDYYGEANDQNNG